MTVSSMTVQAAVMEVDAMSGLEVPVWGRYSYLVNQVVQGQVSLRQSLPMGDNQSFDVVNMSDGNYVKINQLCNTRYNTRRVFIRYSRRVATICWLIIELLPVACCLHLEKP